MKSRKIAFLLVLTLIVSQIAFPMIGLAAPGDGPGGGPGEGPGEPGGPGEGPPPSMWDPANTKIISTNPSITPLFEMTGGQSDGENGPPPGFFTAGFNAETVTLDTEIEIKISADQKPFMLMNMGNLQSWSYDETNKIVTIKTKPIDFYHIEQQTGQYFHMPKFIVVGFGPNPGGGKGEKDQGPPAEAEGMWMSTNASEWEFGPNKDFDGDGMPSSMVLKLTGKAGEAGFFKMFWPTALLKKMGLTKDTLAGFINGDQISTTIQEVEGGVIITFNVTYKAAGSEKPKKLNASSSSAFKTITVATGKAAALTLSYSKKSIKKGKAVRLSGYVNPKRSRVKVFLYRKLKGEKKFKRVGAAKTNAKGFYRFTRKPPKTAYYRTATKKGRKLIYSSAISVAVK